MNAAFHVPYLATGLALMVVTALIVISGLKRVAAVTEKLVPLMALFYVAGALIIVVMHAGNIPAALAAIFKGAFNLNAAGGGALGYGISQTITWGFKRGAFSNEAGLGSAVMVNSASNVKEPVHQGMWGVFEVFADTIVVCTLTALVILTTGVVDLESGAVSQACRTMRWWARRSRQLSAVSARSSSPCPSCCSPTPPPSAGATTAPRPWSISSARREAASIRSFLSA